MFSSDKNTSEDTPITTTSSARITIGPACSATSTIDSICADELRGAPASRRTPSTP